MTITLIREEAQQVLDALDEYRDSTEDFRVANRCISLIETLRARLERSEVAREGPVREWARISQAEPEPVMLMDAPLLLNGQPLYTTPPQRKEWQGLTDEEANELCFASVEEIEAKLREKNI